MGIAYQRHEAPFAESLIAEIHQAATAIFGSHDPEDCEWRLARMPDVTLFTARDASGMVGFKIGYALTSRRYYSWLGGVHPSHRGRGIAVELMKRQHDWVEAAGYTSVTTEARQTNHAMAALNHRCGMQANGLRFKEGEAIVIYRKWLQ